MFRFNKPVDIIQLFHRANSPASVKVANFLKQVSASVSQSAAEDQGQRDPFELSISEDDPTPGQVETILEYAGKPAISSIIKGANSPSEAIKLFKQNASNLNRPLIVDWNNGKVYAGTEESAILKLLNALPPKN
ncbi:hypothetical protein OQA88_6653 [Cercophora sp. LCS_1]